MPPSSTGGIVVREHHRESGVIIHPGLFCSRCATRLELLDTHSCTAEQGNPVGDRNIAAWPLYCKHKAPFLSAKAGHWGNLRRRGGDVEGIFRTCQSEYRQTVSCMSLREGPRPTWQSHQMQPKRVYPRRKTRIQAG